MTPSNRQPATGPSRGVAVVTGASSGIGAATTRRLADEGFHVVAAARRIDRLDALVAEVTAAGGRADAVPLDVTDDASVAAFVARLEDLSAHTGLTLAALVNNAGGAEGLDPVERSDPAAWSRMYEVNVLGALRVTRALLPLLERGLTGWDDLAEASIVMIGSTAALGVYPGGAGYTGAKHALRAMTETLRLELGGRPIRVIEIDPGMVRTPEFSLNRFGGDAERADAVYAGVPFPLVADDVADAIAWTLTRPQHVNIDRLVIRPVAQSSHTTTYRRP